MPRERKGKSPQFHASPERATLTTTLKALHILLVDKWKLQPKDFVLVDEFAYVLQGYNVRSTEVKSGHLDVYVKPEALPWKASNERSLIPPRGSEYLSQYSDFMEINGYGLDLLSGKPEIFKTPTVNYTLSGDRTLKLMRVQEMTDQFAQQTIMHYSLEDVGAEKIHQWYNKLLLIREVAEQKHDQNLMSICNRWIKQSQARWKDVLQHGS